MIKAIIFDWGGVIAPNPLGGWLGSLATKVNMTIEETLSHWNAAGYKDLSRGTIDDKEFFRLFEISLGRKLPDDVSRIWIDGSAFNPWPEMLNFIKQLKENGIKVGILSNTVKPMSDIAIQRGLYDGFAPLILSSVVGSVKPELPIYQRALDELHLSANECVYIDDLPKNLISANALGMITILASDNPSETIDLIQRVLKNNL